MLMIINIEFLILFFIFFFLGIYGLVKSTDLSASFFILLIALVAAIGINLHYRYAYFSYEKLKNDTCITQKLSIKNIKWLFDISVGDKLNHTFDILGFKLLCLDENGKKIRLIFPLKQRITSPIPMLKLSKKFKPIKKKLYKEWEFSFLKETRFILDSTLSLEKICYKYVKQEVKE